MSNVTNSTPDRKELRKFGLIFATGLILVFGLFLPWVFERPWPAWPWIVGGAFVAVALILPQSLRPVFWLWMKIGHVLGWINTRIILGIVFFLVFAPIALVLRIMRADLMKQTLDTTASSYRIESVRLPRDRMERPF